MALRGDDVRLAYPLFQEGSGGLIPTSPLQLRVGGCELAIARQLNRRWHSRLPRIGDPPGTLDAGLHFSAEFEGVIYAVAIWSHPVNRNLPQETWLELRRFAIAPDAPKNTGSWMLGIMARLIRKKRPQIDTLVSYQDCDVHQGTIYKAAGWQPTTMAKGKPWNMPGRARPKAQSEADKQRWEKAIRSAC